jgi:hypothetical protein
VFDKKYFQFLTRMVLAAPPIFLDTIINITILGIGDISGTANTLSIVLRITTPISSGVLATPPISQSFHMYFFSNRGVSAMPPISLRPQTCFVFHIGRGIGGAANTPETTYVFYFHIHCGQGGCWRHHQYLCDLHTYFHFNSRKGIDVTTNTPRGLYICLHYYTRGGIRGTANILRALFRVFTLIHERVLAKPPIH